MLGGRRCVHVIYPDDLLQADTVCAGRLSVSRYDGFGVVVVAVTA
jgi:hypothetical protein